MNARVVAYQNSDIKTNSMKLTTMLANSLTWRSIAAKAAREKV